MYIYIYIYYPFLLLGACCPQTPHIGGLWAAIELQKCTVQAQISLSFYTIPLGCCQVIICGFE